MYVSVRIVVAERRISATGVKSALVLVDLILNWSRPNQTEVRIVAKHVNSEY